MGIRTVLAANPVELFWNTITSESDKMRRADAEMRWKLYRDKSESALRQEFLRIFRARERRERVEAFATLATCLALFRRIVNEVAGPVYNPPPLRLWKDKQSQAAFELLRGHVRLDRKMDLLTKAATACGTAAGVWRVNQRLGPIFDVIPPHCYTVIPDPDDPTRELGFAYRKLVAIDGRQSEEHWVCWDDEIAFELGPRGNVVRMPITTAGGHPGRLPCVTVHMVERTSTDYWEAVSAGADLAAAHKALGYIVAMTLRGHHTQGHNQLGLNGDPGNFPVGQILDGENIVMAGAGNSVSNIAAPWDPTGALKTADMIITTVAANYGVDRERLNAKIDSGSGSGLAMLERRAETLEVMFEAEKRSLVIGAEFSRAAADPTLRMPLAAEIMSISYADLSSKTDRETQLRVRREEKSQGLRSVVDDKLEDSPELEGDRERAWVEIERAAKEEARRVQLYRELNVDPGGAPDQPGQDAQTNGAMGAAVRDGQMTKDQAAAQAKTGPLRVVPAAD